MSYRLLFLLVLGLVGLTGCPPDRPSVPENLTSDDLLGTWSIDRFDSEFMTTGTFLGEDVDQQGSSSISSSALQITFSANGSWASSGDYDLTVTGEDGSESTTREGVGQGSWTFRSDTLFLDGLQNFNGSGNFELGQPLIVSSFAFDEFTTFTTSFDQTETDQDLDIELRTQADWNIGIRR